LMAVGAGLKVFQLLQVLLLFEYFGPLVLCVVSVFKDISKVAIIFVVVFAAFSLAAFTMIKPFQEADEGSHFTYTLREDSPVASRRGLFMTMLWHLMDPGHPYQVYILNNKTGNATEEDFSLEFSHFMIIALWFVYDIITVVLMLNILVAIMNTTYSKLWERANIEWNYNKTYYMASFLSPRSVFPSALGFLYYIAALVYHFKTSEEDRIEKVRCTNENRTKYMKLLKRLLKMSQHTSYENAHEDYIISELKEIKEELKLLNPNSSSQHKTRPKTAMKSPSPSREKANYFSVSTPDQFLKPKPTY